MCFMSGAAEMVEIFPFKLGILCIFNKTLTQNGRVGSTISRSFSVVTDMKYISTDLYNFAVFEWESDRKTSHPLKS